RDEECRWRQLLLVAGNDQLPATQQRGDRIRRCDLGCLVEDDDVEVRLRRQQLTYDERTHRPARLQRQQDVRCFADKVTYGLVPTLQPRLVLNDLGLVTVFIPRPRRLLRAQPTDPRRSRL